MKLLICLISYNRSVYTKKTLKNLRNSISDDADYYLVVSDNASTDGTQKYLKSLHKRGRINGLILNQENYYPGKACNLGWESGLRIYDATHLMRLDNDMQLTKNWNYEVEKYFKAIPELGQLGIEHEAIENPEAELKKRNINGYTINEFPGCVGGPMIMPRKLWDEGIRYDESPWINPDGTPTTGQEDSALSSLIKRRGYIVGHSQTELGRTFATQDKLIEYPEYYIKTMSERGLFGIVDKIKEMK